MMDIRRVVAAVLFLGEGDLWVSKGVRGNFPAALVGGDMVE